MLSKSLMKKSSLYFIGNISTKFINFLLLPLYAYFMTTAEYGTFDLMNTLSNLFAPILFISIWDGALKFLLDDNTLEYESILSTVFIFSGCILTIISIGLIVYSSVFEVNNFYIGICMLLVVSTFLSLWQYSARGLKENTTYISGSIVSSFVNFILCILMLVIFKLGILSLILSFIISSIVGIAIIEIKVGILKKISINKFDLNLLKNILKYSLPLAINAIAGWGILSICRLIVSIKLGSEINGIYAYATKFNQFVMLFGQIFNMAWLEEAILSINNKDANIYFSNSIKNISRIMIGVLMLAGPSISIYYEIISNTDYSQAVNIFPMLLIVPIIQTISTNIGCIFQAKNKTNIIFYTTIVGAISSILISWIFIDKYKLVSVAIAQAIGMLVMLILRKIIVDKIFKIDIESKFLFVMILYYISSTYLCINYNMIIKFIVLTLNLLITLYINKETISEIGKILLSKIGASK